MKKAKAKTQKRSKKQAGLDPKHASRHYQGLFAYTGDLVHVVSEQGAFLEVNPAWEDALGYNKQALQDSKVFHLIHPKSRQNFTEIFERCLKEKKCQKVEAFLIAKNGQILTVEGKIDPVLCEGKIIAVQGIFKDLTQSKYLEKLKDDFVSTISHELRTPMTVIREGVSQVVDGVLGPVRDEQKTFLEMVLENIDRLARIINDLLDVSKLEAGHFRIRRSLTDIVEVAKTAVKNLSVLAQQKKLKIRTEFPKEHIEIYIDPDKIAQVFTNLIGNALKFTNQGSITVSIAEDPNFVQCRIADTGKGISQEDLPKIFGKFHQFSRVPGPGDRGTGLGLAICKGLVELHHGKISVESVPMQGTVFTFLLPKYTAREIFKDHITTGIKKCLEEGSRLSLVIFSIVDFESLRKVMGKEVVERMVLEMEKLIDDSLRRAADIAIKDTRAILVMLPDTKKENAYIVSGRLRQIVEEFLAREKPNHQVRIHSDVVTFPDDAEDIDRILEKIYS